MVGKILDDLEVKLTVVNERDDNYDATSGLGLGRRDGIAVGTMEVGLVEEITEDGASSDGLKDGR